MTMDILSRFFLPISAFAATILSWAALIICHRFLKSSKSEPGATAHQTRLDNAAMQVSAAVGGVIATPIVLIAAFFVAHGTGNAIAAWDALAVFLTGGLALWGYAIIRWRSALGRQRTLQWQHAAMEMVEKAVALLEQRGYTVFHDFKTGHVKINHLLIGPKGVFALQTMVHPIPPQSDLITDITVTYDGRTLFFPNERDHLSIETAHSDTEHFSEWLSQQLGTPIMARAIVALPGWQIKRISSEGISVIHPGQLEALFQYVQARPLSAEMIQQISGHVRRHMGNPPGPQNQDDVRETTGSYY